MFADVLQIIFKYIISNLPTDWNQSTLSKENYGYFYIYTQTIILLLYWNSDTEKTKLHLNKNLRKHNGKKVQQIGSKSVWKMS